MVDFLVFCQKYAQNWPKKIQVETFQDIFTIIWSSLYSYTRKIQKKYFYAYNTHFEHDFFNKEYKVESNTRSAHDEKKEKA